jgi:hypothetical protein
MRLSTAAVSPLPRVGDTEHTAAAKSLKSGGTKPRMLRCVTPILPACCPLPTWFTCTLSQPEAESSRSYEIGADVADGVVTDDGGRCGVLSEPSNLLCDGALTEAEAKEALELANDLLAVLDMDTVDDWQ